MEFRWAMREREQQYERLERVLELVSYILQCYLVSSEPRIEPCNVFTGSTFSELFYFYFQRVKKSKRKQGGGGIVVKFFI